jgi:hypothetical protein
MPLRQAYGQCKKTITSENCKIGDHSKLKIILLHNFHDFGRLEFINKIQNHSKIVSSFEILPAIVTDDCIVTPLSAK